MDESPRVYLGSLNSCSNLQRLPIARHQVQHFLSHLLVFSIPEFFRVILCKPMRAAARKCDIVLLRPIIVSCRPGVFPFDHSTLLLLLRGPSFVPPQGNSGRIPPYSLPTRFRKPSPSHAFSFFPYLSNSFWLIIFFLL